MRPEESEKALRDRLGRTANPSVGHTLKAMLCFYEDERAEGCVPEVVQDLLLYEWGTYDWGNGKHFMLSLSRFFHVEGEDEPFQLSLTVLFAPNEEYRLLGSGEKLCESRACLPDLLEFIQESPPYKMLGKRTCPEIEVFYEHV